jgi:DNA replication and repair protein RecF
MHLKELSVINFKNYEQAELSFCNGVNVFVGLNGAGKTNLLDAIYYLSFCKSFFNPIDSQNIRHNEQFFVVQGEFDKEEQQLNIHCGIKKGQKKSFKRNKKEYDRLADHIGLLPLVMISPVDSELIYDGSELRRKFIDGVIAQYNRPYLDHLMSYQKAVQQRNALLKKFNEQRYFDGDALEIWNMQLEQFGVPIFEARKAFLKEFIPLFQEYYELISGGKERVRLDYDTKLNDTPFHVLLEEAKDKDKALGYTSVGTHKDDLKFLIEDQPIKKFGSQGQQKSYLIALKLAQFTFIKQVKKITPLLLLDDIFDKLDKNRVRALMELVSDQTFGQIFVTDANKQRINDLFEGIDTELKIFPVEDGQVKVDGVPSDITNEK